MNRPKVQKAFLALILLAAGGVAFVKIAESRWTDTSLEGQTRRLESFWPNQRRAAAAGLVQFAGEADRVTPVLLKALRDPDREVRTNALESLKGIGNLPEIAAPVLVDILQHDQDSTIRVEAASLLGMTKVKSAADALVETLDDHDPAVRLAAMNALVFHGSSAASGPAIDKLIALMASDQPENVRTAAIQALGSLGRDQERVARTMAEILVKDPSPSIRNDAALLLRNTKFGFEIPAHIAALDDPSAQVRLTAGATLGAIGLSDDRAVPALCRAARKADELTREGMGINIGKLRWDAPPESLPAEAASRRFQTAVSELKSVLDQKDSAARKEVVTVLGRVAGSYQQSAHPTQIEAAREAIQLVLARFLDEKEDLSIRLHAMYQWNFVQPAMTPPIRGRRNPGDPGAATDQIHARSLWLPALAKALGSSEEGVRSRAIELLIDGMKVPRAEDWYREAWRKIVPDLARATASNDIKVRNGAVTILDMLGPEASDALDALKALAKDSQNTGVREAVERAIESISSLDRLKSKDPKIRIAASETLARSGWRATSAVPALVIATADTDKDVRLAATKALHVLGIVSVTAVPPLAAALPKEPEAAVRVEMLAALEAIAPGTPPVVGAHVSALRDPDPTVRKAAATFQKVPLDGSVVSALATALADSNAEVQGSVAGSLTAILFEDPTVVPTLIKALGDDKQRPAVLAALDADVEKDPDARGLGHFRTGIPGLQAAVAVAIPALRDALTTKNEEVVSRLYGLLGRLVSFSAKTRDEKLRAAVEPAVLIYLPGLESSDLAIREDVLSRLDSIPLHRPEIMSALLKYLERSDQPAEDRMTAFAALAAQAAFADSDPNLRKVLEPAVPILTAALDAPEPEIRESAVLALGYIGSVASPAEEKVRNLSKGDPVPKVRKNAESALKSINGAEKMRRPSRKGAGGGTGR